jgi:DNA-binding MarR family transcriptional regulator
MTLPELNPLIHAPVRLQICAILFAADEAEFALVREETGVSESVLSKQVKLLDEAGYVTIRKAILASRQRTWLALTETGRKAFASHMRALTGLVDRAANGIAAE